MEIVSENATSLAWIGDAVYTLRVREHLLKKGYRKADILQKRSAKFNSAKGQAAILKQLEENDFFNEDEKVILQRGRAANIHSKAKNADGKTYLEATALEALIGYLHLYDHHERKEQLLDQAVMLGDAL